MLITFTHIAFDLLSANYHNVSLRRMRSCLLFCVIVIAFLISEVKRTDSAQGEKPRWAEAERGNLKKLRQEPLKNRRTQADEFSVLT